MALISLKDGPSLPYLCGGVTAITYPWETLVSQVMEALTARTENSALPPKQTAVKPTRRRTTT